MDEIDKKIKRMERLMYGICLLTLLGMLAYALAGCTEADKVSMNVSQEADNFNVLRRLAVINSRTDKVEFELVGAFSLQVDHDDGQIEIVCEMEDGTYKKHIIGLNENTMYVVEDIGGAAVNKYRYQVNYIPESIIPFKVVQND